MRYLKGFAAFALAVILIAGSALALGAYAIAEAVSEDAVEQAITRTDAVGQLTGNIIARNTINLGGAYGEEMQTILKSDAMTEFFTAYTARSLHCQIYGGEMEEIGADDLNAAFSRGMDECLEKGTVTMGKGERSDFDEALNTSMPNLTKGVNYVLSQMKLTEYVEDDTGSQLELAKTITSDEVRYGAAGIAIMACVVLIALYWGSKFGLLLSGLLLLVVAAFFYMLSVMIGQTLDASGGSIVLSRQMLYVMVSYGALAAARAGAVTGCALCAACPAFKLLFKKRRQEE